jgi:hypothetical protein
MTAEQIEAAARRLCQARGIDPDAMDGTGYMVVSWEPWLMKEGGIANWRVVAPEIKRFAQIGAAIAATKQPMSRVAALRHSPGYAAARERIAFDKGWVAAARWAKRDDLLADLDSPAYLRERDAALGTTGTYRSSDGSK